MYSEKMVAVPESGSDMVTTVWSLYQVGTFFSALVVAGVADQDPANFFWVCLPIAGQLALPVGAGWLGEKSVVGGFRREKISANGRYFALGSLMGVAAIGLGVVSLWASVLTQAVYSVVVSVILCGLSLWWLPPMHGMLVGRTSGGELRESEARTFYVLSATYRIDCSRLPHALFSCCRALHDPLLAAVFFCFFLPFLTSFSTHRAGTRLHVFDNRLERQHPRRARPVLHWRRQVQPVGPPL